MVAAPTFDELVAEGAAEPVAGWDFSWFDGRAAEERPSWGYSRLLAERMRYARAALDIQTGGGEVLGQVPDPPPVLVATESWRPNIDVARRNLRGVRARVVEAEDTRPAIRRVSFDAEALSLVVLVAMLGEDAGGGSIYTEPRQMLSSVFGPAMQAEILTKARADLFERVRLLLDEELVRFVEVIDAAGECDDVAAIRLYQAEFSLEAVR